MIWVNGEIVPDDALKISVLDRTFEHGLGLFETLRTWSGRAVLLRRHLDRMRRSAGELGLPLDESALPDEAAVAALRLAEESTGDLVLRITLSGGTSREGGSVVWMRARPLPAPTPVGGVELVPTWGVIHRRDRLARHKTLNYWSRLLAQESCDAREPREALLVDAEGLAWEGSRSNVFAVRGDMLLTPPESGPLVPGIMRRVVLEQAELLGLEVREEDLPLEVLRMASEVFLTNSVRGVMSVRRLESRLFDDPKTCTMRIRSEVGRWLACEGGSS